MMVTINSKPNTKKTSIWKPGVLIAARLSTRVASGLRRLASVYTRP